MVVIHHERARFLQYREPQDVARGCQRLVDRADENLAVFEDAVARVEPRGAETLLPVTRAARDEVAAQSGSVVVGRPFGLAVRDAPREFDRCRDARGFRRPDAGNGGELTQVAPPQRRHALVEQIARELNGVLAANAGAEEDCQELGVGECFRPVREQTLARGVILGKGTAYVGHRCASNTALMMGGVATAARSAIAYAHAELVLLASGLMSIERLLHIVMSPAAGDSR